MKKRVLSLLLALVMVLTLLPTGALAVTTDLAQWLGEGNRALKVCGVTVTADNARNILAGTDYAGCGRAEFCFMVQGSNIMPTLILDGLNVDDTSLDYVVEYEGSRLNSSDTGRFQEDILYIRLDRDCALHARGNDIEVRNASLDLSGLIGDEKLTLVNSWPSELEVENGDLHIHDCALDASGIDVGIEVTNGALTVSGEDTVVSFHCGGHDSNVLIRDLISAYQLTLEEILRLENVAFVAPQGAKATLLENQFESDDGQTMYQYTVKLVDENNECVYEDIVIKKPHAHPVCGETCTHGGEHDAVTWTAWDGTGSLTAGNYYLSKDVDLGNSLTISDAVNLCLNGHNLNCTGNGVSTIQVEGAGALTLCDCGSGGTVTGNWHIIDNTGGKVELYGGTVTGNAEYIIYSSGTLVIGGNTVVTGAPNQRAVNQNSSGTLTIKDNATITVTNGDSAVASFGAMKLSGAPKLSGGSNAPLMLQTSADATLDTAKVDATEYTGDALKVWEYGIRDAVGGVSIKVSEENKGKFTLTNSGYEYQYENGGLVIREQSPHSHAVCGAECKHTGEGAHAAVGFDTALTAEMVNGDVFENTYTLSEGNYYLAEDIETKKKIEVSGNVNLCFNGHTITYNDGSNRGAFIKLQGGGNPQYLRLPERRRRQGYAQQDRQHRDMHSGGRRRKRGGSLRRRL